MKFPPPESGFTLVELLAAIAIVAVLAAIAVPSYSSFVYKGEIKTATADAKALSLNFENTYQRTLSYPTIVAADTLTTKFTGWKPASNAFSFSAVGTAAAYTITVSGSATGYSGCKITLTHDGSCSITGCKSGNGAC